jgi:hypothetical protein
MGSPFDLRLKLKASSSWKVKPNPSVDYPVAGQPHRFGTERIFLKIPIA